MEKNSINQDFDYEVISLEELIEIEYALAGYKNTTTGLSIVNSEYKDFISESLDIAYDYYSESEIIEAFNKYKNKKNSSIWLPSYTFIVFLVNHMIGLICSFLPMLWYIGSFHYKKSRIFYSTSLSLSCLCKKLFKFIFGQIFLSFSSSRESSSWE